jgi:hypothetical protein
MKISTTFSTSGRIAQRIPAAAAATLTLAALLGVHASTCAGQSDPPNRVARLAVAQGNVSLEPAGVDQFSAAEVNYPLTVGDRLYADNSSLAELQTSGLAVRLGNGADVTVSSLTDSVAQFGLAQGSIRLVTRDLYAAPDPNGQPQQAVVEIDTANAAILVQQPGDIRVDSYPQTDRTVVTVSSGAVEITGDGLDRVIGAGQAVRLTGSNPVYAQAVRPLGPDALDGFDQQQEQMRAQSLAVSGQYVDPGMIGISDLGEYGDWTPDPQYGAVWYPHALPADWIPYQNGHWAWIAPWGWTWVEAEPWGFAPFHYGRWAEFNGRWGWVAGPSPAIWTDGGVRPPRPIYAPALVAFVGGPAFSVSVGFGAAPGAGVTAWFALGPREPYVPWYQTTPGYVNRVNATNLYATDSSRVRAAYQDRTAIVYNISVVHATYANRQAATIAIPQQEFASGRQIDRQAGRAQPLRLDAAARQQLNAAPILPHPLVTPTARMAAPQSPPRVVPPLMARPVLVNGRNSTSAMRPETVGAAASGLIVSGPVRPTLKPLPPAAASEQSPLTQPVQPNSGGGRSNIYGPTSVQETRPAVAGQTGTASAQTGTVQGSQQPQRGSFPVQRMHQPVASAAPAAVAAPMPRPPDVQRPLVNRTAPQPEQPSFARQQQAIERSDPGRPLGPEQLQNLRNNQPAGPHTAPEPVAHPLPAPAAGSGKAAPAKPADARKGQPQ